MERTEIEKLYNLPFGELLHQASSTHRENFDPNEVQCATLLSIKTGACPEDCKYCSQSGHYKTDIEREKLLPIDEIVAKAKEAKSNGATRFCMGAAWRTPPKKSMDHIIEAIRAVKAEGLEACVTLGMLDSDQAKSLKEAGLDYYNHNLDTSREHYPNVITTRTYDQRLETIKSVSEAGINVCCGGILGLGESRADRIAMLAELSNMNPKPKSVPINRLVPIEGTPMESNASIDDLEFVRTVAVARLVLPKAMIRLSAGRETMSELMQAICFYAGANSIFLGSKLLTVPNKVMTDDRNLLSMLGMRASELVEEAGCFSPE